MDVKRAIAELTSQVSEINYDSDEEILLKGRAYSDKLVFICFFILLVCLVLRKVLFRPLFKNLIA